MAWLVEGGWENGMQRYLSSPYGVPLPPPSLLAYFHLRVSYIPSAESTMNRQ